MTRLGAATGARRSPVMRYQEMELASRIEGATPHALVAMLYDELGAALDVLARAIDAGDPTLRMTHHERASSILHALEAGLDRVGGGDLAMSLTAIYRQMQRRLIAARSGDVAAIVEVRAGVTSLSEAWRAISQ